MASELLQREQEFHKLNEELEKRTKALMHEVDSVMCMQKNIASETWQNYTTANMPKINSEESISTSDVSGICTNEINNWGYLPDECKQLGTKGLTQYLKSNVTALQNDLDDMKKKYKIKCNEFKQLQTEYAKLEEDKNKVNHSLKVNKDHKEKLSHQLVVSNSKLLTQETEIATMKRENDILKKELKNINASSANSDLRLNKALEEVDKLKATLKNVKKSEKELRESQKKQIVDLTAMNKKLDKQTTELANGFKKQLLLIDNLKKQKMYLESAKITQMAEEEFLRILDWKPSTVSTQ